MAIIIRVPGSNWANKGFANINPFILSGLVYGFDFRDRSSMLTDVTGSYVITPKKVDGAAGIVNVTDSSILTPVDSGLGVEVALGYLQSNEALAAFGHGGAPFTIMVAARGSSNPFPAGKVVSSAPTSFIAYDYGSVVTPQGFAVEAAIGTGRFNSRVENGSSSLAPDTVVTRAVTQPQVLFLTYDGTNWTLYNKTFGLSATGTNVGLSVGNPIALNTAPSQGKVNLGGNALNTSTLFAYYPVMYQSAKWNRVLTADEITEQYARTKSGRQSLSL